jgi:hypothetical protein
MNPIFTLYTTDTTRLRRPLGLLGGEVLIDEGRAGVGAEVAEKRVGGDVVEVDGEFAEGGGGWGGGKGGRVGDEGAVRGREERWGRVSAKLAT